EPVVLYGSETWTLTLREEQRLRVFENKMFRKIFGAKRDEVTGEWRKLHNTELHALYSSPDIIRNIKSRRLRWVGHVAFMDESKNAYRVLVGRPEGKRPLGRSRRSRNSPTDNRSGNGTGSVPATVTGDGLKLVPVNRQSTINIDLHDNVADLNDVAVIVTAPSRRNLPVKLFRNRDQILANFTATEIGEHIIDIRVRDQRVVGAPFRTHAYNSRAIQVGRIPNGVLGQPVEFEIDGSGAGSGNLEILVNGGHVTSFVRNLGNQRFLASFVPHEALSHLVEMKFNGETVPANSPKNVGVNLLRDSPLQGRQLIMQCPHLSDNIVTTMLSGSCLLIRADTTKETQHGFIQSDCDA
ncbi:hypothetical protein ANN_26006, partial [Periplaneta americana]